MVGTFQPARRIFKHSFSRERREIGSLERKVLEGANGSANTMVLTRIYFGGADPERTIKRDSVRVIRSAESE
jgi:hypothetical protein